jgi:hypothetical protein
MQPEAAVAAAHARHANERANAISSAPASHVVVVSDTARASPLVMSAVEATVPIADANADSLTRRKMRPGTCVMMRIRLTVRACCR